MRQYLQRSVFASFRFTICVGEMRKSFKEDKRFYMEETGLLEQLFCRYRKTGSEFVNAKRLLLNQLGVELEFKVFLGTVQRMTKSATFAKFLTAELPTLS